MSFPAQTIFLLIYQSPATARYALEMSPSKCCSSKGLFPWTLCLLYVVALFAPTQEILLKYSLDLPYIQIGIYLIPYLTFLISQGFQSLKLWNCMYFPLFLPLWATYKGNFFLLPHNLIQEPCGSPLCFPCGVSVNIHCGTHIGMTQQLLHILWLCTTCQKIGGVGVS